MEPGKQKTWHQAKRHLNFMCKIYKIQIDAGRWLLHEHPVTAGSWKERCILDVMREGGVRTTVTDQCMFGLTTTTTTSTGRARKRTRFMSNAGCILDELSVTCDGSHFHIPLVNGRAAKAAVYPEELRKAICR